MAEGPYPIPGALMPTWLIRFDKDGACTSPATQAALLKVLEGDSYTDILFYSHGWNTAFDAAVDQYSRFLKAFQPVAAAHPPKLDFRPIFVGVTWPSTWFPGSGGPTLASADGVGVPLQGSLEEARLGLGEAIPAESRERYYALTDRTAISPEEALELAGLVAPVLSPAPEEVDSDAPSLDAIGALNLANAFAAAEGNDFGTDLDLIGTIGSGGADLAAAGDFNPFKFVKIFSVYQMKDRAGYVGARGVARLLEGLLNVSGTRPVHVFGHSFGAKVMLSAICAATLARPVRSLLLLQPAISHLALAPAGAIDGRPGPGGYHAALESARVEQPILTTYSRKDHPLHDVFHFALRRPADLGELRAAFIAIAAAGAGAGEPPDKYAALGGYGPRKSGEALTEILAPGAAWPAFTTRLVALDGSADRINDHGDVANPYTAWALRRLIAGA